MEYVSGGSLGALLRVFGTLPEDKIAYICRGIVNGLHHFHNIRATFSSMGRQPLV
jgi:serine/threonine protein kinase